MQHSCWLIGLVVVAYLWHALIEFLEEQGILDEWFEKHNRLRRVVFTIGAALLLAPAAYYAGELHEILNPSVTLIAGSFA